MMNTPTGIRYLSGGERYIFQIALYDYYHNILAPLLKSPSEAKYASEGKSIFLQLSPKDQAVCLHTTAQELLSPLKNGHYTKRKYLCDGHPVFNASLETIYSWLLYRLQLNLSSDSRSSYLIQSAKNNISYTYTLMRNSRNVVGKDVSWVDAFNDLASRVIWALDDKESLKGFRYIVPDDESHFKAAKLYLDTLWSKDG